MGTETTKTTDMLKHSMNQIPLGDCAIIAANISKFNTQMQKVRSFESSIKRVIEKSSNERIKAQKHCKGNEIKIDEMSTYIGESYQGNSNCIPHGYGKLTNKIQKTTLQGYFQNGDCEFGVLSLIGPEDVHYDSIFGSFKDGQPYGN
eukprot:CAMPEP_0116891928 /NCGR_PEP_ID=MMETSP0467-20121206/2249_1 /TAXON_ID=283647 /ORGANISM="Mesodinium pulex, Strain SPMC105" /LENGTH=146 /DNA_ID=CAMNT_0004560743 /DNA_START=802 /DNA_END=1242 /DNA_ORIENTATION=-